ncbi:MAG: RHS repeat protein, partial [Pseudomonadota bacterium]|nr:RHS repeat protein [Pseudomonadota bacterium]
MLGETIRVGLACALAFCCSSLAAQEGKDIWEEYGKRVTKSASVSAIGPDLFGDRVSMSNGALSFSVTDVSLPGNNALPVAFTRTFQVRNSADPYIHNDFPLEDWEIDLPNISGTFAGEWISGASATPYQRCSVTGPGAAAPPYITFDNTLFEPKDYWQGHTLSLPTGGGELLLLLSGQPRPTAGGPYFWITADQTRLSCLTAIKNWSGGGEGFLATAPDGTRYWFDWMGATMEDALRSKQGKLLARARVALYPSRVEDRFGNYVEYTYSNARNAPVRLIRIRANDGRQLDIAHNTHGAVSSVTTGTRTWQYQYALANTVDHTLTTVIQPDSSRWGISFAGLLDAAVRYERDPVADGSWRSCTRQPFLEDPQIAPQIFHGSISHPSGATGEFTVGITEQGRTNVPALCDNVTSPNNVKTDDVAIFPIYHHALSLTRKRISGPGMDPMEWNYAYSAMHSFYYPGNATAEFPVCTGDIDCSIPVCTSDDCAGASTTKVVDAKGDWIRHTYGTSYRYNEGKLLSVEVGTGEATVLRKTASTYDLSQVDKAYPARWGVSPRMNWEGFPSDFHRPQLTQTVHQDAATFSSTTSSFDQFARQLGATDSSSKGFSRSRTTAYHDNQAAWVLGQVQKASVNGIVSDETVYHATTALPVEARSFGKFQNSLGYHADGTLSRVTDGRNLSTMLSGW